MLEGWESGLGIRESLSRAGEAMGPALPRAMFSVRQLRRLRLAVTATRQR
jgi:hypothetical protein